MTGISLARCPYCQEKLPSTRTQWQRHARKLHLDACALAATEVRLAPEITPRHEEEERKRRLRERLTGYGFTEQQALGLLLLIEGELL